jgi:hypothetical protein
MKFGHVFSVFKKTCRNRWSNSVGRHRTSAWNGLAGERHLFVVAWASRSSATLDCFDPVMSAKLINIIMNDGSRQFGDLPESIDWHQLRDHIDRLDGVQITDFITDNVTEVWIDFFYRGQQFSVNNQFGEYWFFVDNPRCKEEILEAVLGHCELVLVSA